MSNPTITVDYVEYLRLKATVTSLEIENVALKQKIEQVLEIRAGALATRDLQWQMVIKNLEEQYRKELSKLPDQDSNLGPPA